MSCADIETCWTACEWKIASRATEVGTRNHFRNNARPCIMIYVLLARNFGMSRVLLVLLQLTTPASQQRQRVSPRVHVAACGRMGPEHNHKQRVDINFVSCSGGWTVGLSSACFVRVLLFFFFFLFLPHQWPEQMSLVIRRPNGNPISSSRRQRCAYRRHESGQVNAILRRRVRRLEFGG